MSDAVALPSATPSIVADILDRLAKVGDELLAVDFDGIHHGESYDTAQRACDAARVIKEAAVSFREAELENLAALDRVRLEASKLREKGRRWFASRYLLSQAGISEDDGAPLIQQLLDSGDLERRYEVMHPANGRTIAVFATREEIPETVEVEDDTMERLDDGWDADDSEIDVTPNLITIRYRVADAAGGQ